MKTFEIKPGVLALALVAVVALCASLARAEKIVAAAKSFPELAGRSLYISQCGYCHGADGKPDAGGHALPFPKPRDLTGNIFKLRSTVPGCPPNDEDLLKTVTRGIPGSGMPSFAFLSEKELRAIVLYLKTLSPVFADESCGRQPGISLDEDPKTYGGPSLAFIAAGKAAYTKLPCVGCHGSEGRGDGPAMRSLKDAAGIPIRLRDFSQDPFKGGSTASDIYVRITTGMDGTPMPAWGKLSSVVRWQLAYYLRSLCKAPGCDSTAEPAGFIAPLRTSKKLPFDDPLSPGWQSALATRVLLFPLGNRGAPPPDLMVRSFTDGRTIAFLLKWADATRDASTVRPQDFRDSVAIQFFNGVGYPPIAMGSRDSEVTIWQWKADWQEELNIGRRLGPLDAHPWMMDQIYPRPVAAALEAGNQIALARSSPVEEATAKGPGTITPKPVHKQHVSGRGVWRDGYWYVLLSRPLGPDSGIDIPGGQTKLAFAIWNGSDGNRSGEKAASTWYPLVRKRH